MLVPISTLLAGALRHGPSTCHLGWLDVLLHVADDDQHTDHLHQRPGQHLWLPGGPEGHGDGHHTRRPGHQFAGPVCLLPSRCTGEIIMQTTLSALRQRFHGSGRLLGHRFYLLECEGHILYIYFFIHFIISLPQVKIWLTVYNTFFHCLWSEKFVGKWIGNAETIGTTVLSEVEVLSAGAAYRAILWPILGLERGNLW